MLAARREESAWVHSEGVHDTVPMQECEEAGKAPVGSDLWSPAHWTIRSRLYAREYKTKRQGKIQRVSLASQLFSATPPFEAVQVLVSFMMSVGRSSKAKPLKLRLHDVSRGHLQGTAQTVIYVHLPAEDRQKYGEDTVGNLIKSMCRTQDASHICNLTICGDGRLTSQIKIFSDRHMGTLSIGQKEFGHVRATKR